MWQAKTTQRRATQKSEGGLEMEGQWRTKNKLRLLPNLTGNCWWGELPQANLEKIKTIKPITLSSQNILDKQIFRDAQA